MRRSKKQDEVIEDLLGRTGVIGDTLGGSGDLGNRGRSGVALDPFANTVAGSLGAALAAELHDPSLPSDLAAAAKRIGFDLDKAIPPRHGRDGMAVLLRGVIGEVRTLERLAEGKVPMPAGAKHAVLADFRQPALDIRFADIDGRQLADTANVKIGTSFEVVRRHFAAHPDVRIIYASQELAAQSARHGIPVVGSGGHLPAHGPVVVDTRLNAGQLSDQVHQHLAMHHGVTWLEVLNWFPIVTMGVIGGRALIDKGRGLPPEEVKHRAVDRSAVAAVTWVTARVLFGTGALGPAAPVVLLAEAFVVSTLVSGVRERTRRTERLRELTELLESRPRPGTAGSTA